MVRPSLIGKRALFSAAVGFSASPVLANAPLPSSFSVYFAFGSAELRDSEKETISRAAAFYSRLSRGPKLRAVGYADDAEEHAGIAEAISLARAAALTMGLRECGLLPNTEITQEWGLPRTLFYTVPNIAAALAADRRATIDYR